MGTVRDVGKNRDWLSLFALAIVLSSCTEPVVETTEVLRPVRTTTAIPLEATEVTVAGVTSADVDSQLSFRTSGTIVSVPIDVGDRVRKGQILARLDPADAELEAERAKAALAQVEAAQRQARADYDRVRGLYENDNASKADLDAARSASDSAAAQVDASRRALDQSQRQISYTTLRAPVAGDVAGLEVEVNEAVQQGQTIVRLTSGSTPEVELAVSEISISLIQAGMPVSVTIDALQLRDTTSIQGVVEEVGVATAAGASTYPVKVRLVENDSRIRSGMAAEVRFQFSMPGGSNSVVVPQVAVGEDRDGRFVFVLESTDDPAVGVARRRGVAVGEITATTGVEISDGLAVGETVVTAGVRRLVDGTRVRQLTSAADS